MRDCSYCQDGTAHLHMSDLGSCVRSQAAQLQGFSTVEAPEFVQAWFTAGHAHEADLLARMRALGWDIGGEQALVVLLGAVPLVGHLDAGGEYEFRSRCVIEAKAPNAWARFEKAYKTADWSDPLMGRYAYQTSCYGHGMDMEVVVACCDPDSDDRIKMFTIEQPVYTLEQIHDRVAQIVKASQGSLPSCSQRDFPCPTVFLCQHEADERVVLDDPALATTLRTYQQLTETVRAGEQAEKARKALKTDLPVGRYDVDGIPLTVSTVKGRSYISEDALKEDGLDPEKYRRQGAGSVRWIVGD